tara:strand:+ start:3484 stop:3702 length:219 start_codon:yes stop_codon:yes gene_type:complete
MIDVNIKYDILDYVLFEGEKRTKHIAKLTTYEAKQINYAYRLNRTNKVYKLKSEISSFYDDNSTIIVLPKDQ